MKAIITEELVGAWQTREIDVPEGTTEDDIKDNSIDIEWGDVVEHGHDQVARISEVTFQ